VQTLSVSGAWAFCPFLHLGKIADSLMISRDINREPRRISEIQTASAASLRR